MNFSERSKIATTSWSRRVGMLARRIGFPNTSARWPVANISTRPNHLYATESSDCDPVRRAVAKNVATRSSSRRSQPWTEEYQSSTGAGREAVAESLRQDVQADGRYFAAPLRLAVPG
jgi:hypothetical protein